MCETHQTVTLVTRFLIRHMWENNMKSFKKKSMKPFEEKNTGTYFAQNITYHFVR